MKVSYKRLWKLLIDKDMKKKDLVKVAHISTYTINKLNRGDNVNTDTLVKICSALNCSIEDIMEVIPSTEIGKILKERSPTA
jgi:DNA-binding Xre family transcriptional regulator